MPKKTIHKYRLEESDKPVYKQKHYMVIDERVFIVLALSAIVISLILILLTIALFQNMII